MKNDSTTTYARGTLLEVLHPWGFVLRAIAQGGAAPPIPGDEARKRVPLRYDVEPENHTRCVDVDRVRLRTCGPYASPEALELVLAFDQEYAIPARRGEALQAIDNGRRVASAALTQDGDVVAYEGALLSIAVRALLAIERSRQRRGEPTEPLGQA